MVGPVLQPVPLHLGPLHVAREKFHTAVHHAQAPNVRALPAPLVEQLEAHADPQERSTAVGCPEGGIGGHTGQARGIQRLHAPPEGPHAGQHHPVGPGDQLGVSGQSGIGADTLEGLLG